MKRRYLVKLSGEEREQLRKLVDKGKAAAYRRRHAQILLKADQAQDARVDWQSTTDDARIKLKHLYPAISN